MLTAPYRIELLGGLRVHLGPRILTRFRTQKAGSLLAYLAYHKGRLHPREELTEVLWPDADMTAGRMYLRSALASLRRQLEPPDVPRGSVLLTHSNEFVSLRAEAWVTDTEQFEGALDRAGDDAPPGEIAERLSRAVHLYGGPLLPGRYESWVLAERDRLAGRYRSALLRLGELSARAGRAEVTLDCAHRLMADDPFDDELAERSRSLLTAAGQSEAVLRKFADLGRLLREGSEEAPPPDLARKIEAATRSLRTMSAAPSEARGADGAAPPLEERADAVTPDPEHHPPRLPLRLTRFFGREGEIAQICERLLGAGETLLTITGAGGFGKTRLAVEAGYRLADAFGGAVYFVPLADLTDPGSIPGAVAAAMRIKADGSDPLDAVAKALSARRSLLILDNFEQFPGGGAALVDSLLGRVPRLACLVTSRQPLGLAGERQIPLSPLATPGTPCPPERLLEFESVRMFVDRAQAARPDFQVTPLHAPAVARLCRHLEGIPLSIELAASWAQTLTPSQMLTRLSSRLDRLTDRKGGLIPRHRTLRGVLEASHDLLPPDLREFFASLSVFRGGCTPEAAVAVCGGEDRLGDFARLLERSFLYSEEVWYGEGFELRYHMLDTLREFAAEVLDGETAVRLRAAHLRCFTRLAERMDIEEKRPGFVHFLRRLAAERENFRAALAHAVETGEADLGLRLAASLWQYWMYHGLVAEARERLDTLLAMPGGDVRAEVRAKGCYCAGYLALMEYDFVAARALLGESLALFREAGTPWGIVAALNQLGFAAMSRGDLPAARRHYEESLDYARGRGVAWDVAVALNGLGDAALRQGDLARARACGEEAREIWKSLGQGWGVAWSRLLLGNVARAEGDPRAARALLLESLEEWRRVEDHKRNIAAILTGLGSISLSEGDADGAFEEYREALKVLAETSERRPDRNTLLECLEGAAILLGARGEGSAAARLLGAVETLRDEAGAVAPPPLAVGDPGLSVANLRARLGERGFVTARSRGRALSWKEALALAVEKTEAVAS